MATTGSGVVDLHCAFWLEEEVTPDMLRKTTLKSIIADVKSPFQRIQVVESGQFGKSLILDGQTQSCRTDESAYHESLVHPAMLVHPNPQNVFIGGGGELATAREVLKHATVHRVLMADIDQLVVDTCRTHMPEWHGGAYTDPRLEIRYDDAVKVLRETPLRFDIIIMDIADPIEAGPALGCYTEEFYKFVLTRLRPGGLFVTQSGPGALFNWHECFSAIHVTLKTAFRHVVPYVCDVASFGSVWGYNMAFNDMPQLLARPAAATSTSSTANATTAGASASAGAADVGVDAGAALVQLPVSVVDELIATRLPANALKFYDGIGHHGLFGVPRPIRLALAQETRVISQERPVYMY